MNEDLLEIVVSELVKQQDFIHDHEESESFISQFEADVSVLSSLSIRLNDFESKLGASLSTPDWSKDIDMQYVSIRRNRFFCRCMRF